MQKAELGRVGERMAVEWLLSAGYTLHQQNWRAGRYEVDIIAQINNTLVFVEVKCRSTETHDFPESAVEHKKQKSMIAAAGAYLEKTGWHGSIRFDIISVILKPHVKKLTHFKDAFFPLSSQ